MLAQLKTNYHELKASRPGKRFQELQVRRGKRGAGSRFLRLALSLGLVAVGVALLVLPGPGVPFLIVGLALLAQEAPFVARALDTTELRLRRLLGQPVG
jgi:hypothetical protein